MRIQTIKSSPEMDADIRIQSADHITMTAVAHISLNGATGEFLGNSGVPANQIATLGDLPTGWTGTINGTGPFLISVVNGIITSVESLT